MSKTYTVTNLRTGRSSSSFSTGELKVSTLEIKENK